MNSYGRKKRDTQIRQIRDLNDDINIREMIKVYETREDIFEEPTEMIETSKALKRNIVCLSDLEYYGIVTTIVVRARVRLL